MSLPQKDIEAFLRKVPFNAEGRRRFEAPRVDVPTALPVPSGDVMSTQEGFGKILNEIARDKSPLAERIVTTSPDVTVSTNLGPWVNRDRKSVASGKSVSVRVDLGGARIIKNKRDTQRVV